MVASKTFLNLDIIKCAKIVAIVGIGCAIGFPLSLAFTVPFWISEISIPISVVFLLSYILIYFGVYKKRPTCLLYAQFILGILIFITLCLAILSILVSLPETIINEKVKEHIYTKSEAKNLIRHGYYIIAGSMVAIIGCTIFVLVIVQRARLYIVENLRLSQIPSEFGSLPPSPFTPPKHNTITPYENW
uniref:Uncharacterized protein n=1 Tax=Panagrolaimus superbus TaxID=310955 RepID=A0A914YS22_9BILA